MLLIVRKLGRKMLGASRSVPYLKETMLLFLSILLAFGMNLGFLVLEHRQKIWQEGRFWVAITGLGLLTGTFLLGN
jgi:hypothetical protein